MTTTDRTGNRTALRAANARVRAYELFCEASSLTSAVARTAASVDVDDDGLLFNVTALEDMERRLKKVQALLEDALREAEKHNALMLAALDLLPEDDAPAFRDAVKEETMKLAF